MITDLDIGGAEMALMRLVSTPSPFSVNHHIVSLKGNGRLESDLRTRGIPVTTVDLKSARNVAGAFIRLSRVLRAERPDLIVTWLYHADLLGTLANLSTVRAPIMWNVRCADMDLSKYSVATRALPWMLAKLSSRTTAIITNSDAGRRAHAAYGYRAQHWQTIPNGFDLAKFRPNAGTRSSVRKELQVDVETLLIGLIARIDPMKGHEVFLAAAAKVAVAVPSAKFVLVGRGTDSPEFRDAVIARGLPLEKFFLLGECLDMPAVLSALDMNVSSSHTEGFSNTIAEAMAVEVPCVATDVGDSAIIVGDTGRIVPKNSPDDLARAMIEFLTLPRNERMALGTAARTRIAQNYALEAINEEYGRTFFRAIRGEFS